jgi:hypothetical protein
MCYLEDFLEKHQKNIDYDKLDLLELKLGDEALAEGPEAPAATNSASKAANLLDL